MRSRRGSGDGMSVNGDVRNTGNPRWRGMCPRPEAREGQAGPPGVADRSVVAEAG